MSVQAEGLQRFIGKPAKDLYGRYVGSVIGVSLDPFGEIGAVGIDEGKQGLVEHPRNQIMVGDDALIVVPDWKLEVEAFRKDNTHTMRKIEALEELNKSGEIPQYVYEELSQNYKDSMDSLQQSYVHLTEKLKSRAHELMDYAKHIERFLGNVKVQHKTGEMSDEVFKVAHDNLAFEIGSAGKEREDIVSILETLTIPLDTLRTEHHTQSQPAVEQGPVTVHLTDDAP
ncbi:MAG: CdvA-like protein [Candidatus Bathyarchaeia archaeon]